ncbi:MAG: ABC transporter permease subunit [Candidatus Lokiarchaeota archaeon]|nr:ABC transporter permease subunit [Candidatus Lokiarchaeota archaeon]MBD3338425.1 ABC transporter permease subunit [Candidatus Lokiarchaeota archaeon]
MTNNSSDKKATKVVQTTFLNNLKKKFFRIYKQIIKEFRLLKTDKMNLLIALVLPPMIITLMATMMNSAASIDPVEVIIVSNDSREYVNQNNYTQTTTLDNFTDKYIDAVEESKYLTLVEFYDTREEKYAMETAREELKAGRIGIIIVIPVEFTEFLYAGLPGIIECVPDSSNTLYLQDKLNAVEDSIEIFVEDNNLDPEIVYQEYEEFSVPSGYNFRFNYNLTVMFSLMVFGISNVLTILVVVQEKPIARLLLTPVKRSEILLSKYIVYSIVLATQITLILVSATLNGMYLAGSLIDLFLALFMLGFSGISLGMFISTLSKTKTEANQIFFAFFIVIVLLSGMFVPIGSMPDYLQFIANILPLSHGSPMLRGILSKGKPALGFDFYSLLALSSCLVIISFIIIQRRRYEV